MGYSLISIPHNMTISNAGEKNCHTTNLSLNVVQILVELFFTSPLNSLCKHKAMGHNLCIKTLLCICEVVLYLNVPLEPEPKSLESFFLHSTFLSHSSGTSSLIFICLHFGLSVQEWSCYYIKWSLHCSHHHG